MTDHNYEWTNMAYQAQIKRADAAEARAAQAEHSAREWQRAAQSASARAAQAEAERDEWKEIAETDHWPFEWQVASQLKAERDEARRELQYAQRRNDFLERRVRELTRQNLQEYEAETPLGQQLDGGGDEVEQ